VTKKRLDQLIQDVEARAVEKVKRGKKNTATKPQPQKKQVALQHPDEPPVVAPATTGPQGMNGYRRRVAGRMAADERRRSFARTLFMSGFNQEEAFKSAGYTAGTRTDMLSSISRLMNEPVVIDELAALTARARAELDAKAVDVVKEWAAIANADVFDYVEQDAEGYIQVRPDLVQSLTVGQRRALQSIKAKKITTEIPRKDGEPIINTTETVEVRLWDKHAALNALAKLQGLFDNGDDDPLNNLADAIRRRMEKAEERLRGKTIEHEPAGH